MCILIEGSTLILGLSLCGLRVKDFLPGDHVGPILDVNPRNIAAWVLRRLLAFLGSREFVCGMLWTLVDPQISTLWPSFRYLWSTDSHALARPLTRRPRAVSIHARAVVTMGRARRGTSSSTPRSSSRLHARKAKARAHHNTSMRSQEPLPIVP